jgi:hypothetical protein
MCNVSIVSFSFLIYIYIFNFIDFDMKGQSLSPTALASNKFYPLISAADAKAANVSAEDA